MTYRNDDQNTIQNESELPQPAWLKALRYLVFGLMLASIFAMLLVGFAAYKMISKSSAPALPAVIHLPEGVSPISVTTLQNGDVIVVHSEGTKATLFDHDGKVKREAVFQ